MFRTRGDANPTADPWTFTLPRDRQARVVAGVPWVGHGLAALSERGVRLLVVGLPAVLIALMALGGLWRESGAAAGGAWRDPRLLVLGALALVPLGVQPSQATFVASSTSAASTFATAADFNTVAVALDDPGALRTASSP